MFPGGCGTSGATATRAVYDSLKANSGGLVIAKAAQILWGSADGKCF
jgi:hypothetical protein